MQLKLRIHLYFQRTYVIKPANGRKKEYHRRVSPIVRIGGRSREIHIPRIKLKKMSQPQQGKSIGPYRLLSFPGSKRAQAPANQCGYRKPYKMFPTHSLSSSFLFCALTNRQIAPSIIMMIPAYTTGNHGSRTSSKTLISLQRPFDSS